MSYSGKFCDPTVFPTHGLVMPPGHTGYINIVKWSSDQAYCVSGGHDKTIILWNPYKQKLIKGFRGIHNHEVLDFVIRNDNSAIVSCGGDRTLF